MKSKKLSYNKILVLFSIIVVLVLMTGCNGGAPPIVNIISAIPSTINQGESSTLTWSVSDATTVTITPMGTVASSGSTSVSPVVTTNYTLTATNSTGSVTATTTINVGQALPVHNLTKNTYYNTIQAALDDADNNNTIEVADGTYDETIDFPPGKKVILESINGPSSTTIRGDDNSFTVILDNSLPGTTIEGFTITHAVGLIGGGIVLVFPYPVPGDTLALPEVGSNRGDGIANLTIDNCNVSNNDGGIVNNGILTITGASTVSGNTTDYCGGGIDNNDILTITGASTVSGNTADYYGGGIANYGTLTITASTISYNSVASDGGGIYISSDSPTIGGYSSAEKNLICGNYKSGNSPSLDQQIRGSSGDLYGTYKDTNYIYANCP